jgi:hypothetical protein
MYSDTITLEKQLEAKKDYHKHLHGELKTALGIYNRLNETSRTKALRTVNRINRIRHQIFKKAKELGYVEKCIDAIPVCKGDCCKWHFPKNLTYLDLFITVCGSPAEEQTALEKQIAFSGGRNQCPLLLESGCFLSFGSRPLVCSNAYPCFAGESYHRFLDNQKIEINTQYMVLRELTHSTIKENTP